MHTQKQIATKANKLNYISPLVFPHSGYFLDSNYRIVPSLTSFGASLDKMALLPPSVIGLVATLLGQTSQIPNLILYFGSFTKLLHAGVHVSPMSSNVLL